MVDDERGGRERGGGVGEGSGLRGGVEGRDALAEVHRRRGRRGETGSRLEEAVQSDGGEGRHGERGE